MKICPNRSASRGFTLIETLVVMAIIVLLASIVIPGLLGRRGEEPVIPEVKPQRESVVPAIQPLGGLPEDGKPEDETPEGDTGE